MSRAAVSACVLLGALGLGACADDGTDARGREDAPAQTGIRYLGGADGAGGYARAEAPRALVFPADHGPHPAFRTEWWYFTGNLETAGARHFGFELTFFRIALAPEAPASESAWATNQVWMAHLALTDTAAVRFHAAEAFSRGALGLAGARATPFEVHVEDWSAAGGLGGPEPLSLSAASAEAAIELELVPRKPPVPHGERGLDRKGPEPGNASYYYSLTRIDAAGRVRSGAEWHDVEGLAWMDREWSTSALSDGVVGWDWFALQLDDGRELMYYRLRRADDSTAEHSGGTLVGADGAVRRLGPDDVALRATRRWTSGATGTTYPVAWSLSVPSADLELDVAPVLDDQELDLSVRYWEGAVRADGSAGGRPVAGRGYLELAGY